VFLNWSSSRTRQFSESLFSPSLRPPLLPSDLYPSVAVSRYNGSAPFHKHSAPDKCSKRSPCLKASSALYRPTSRPLCPLFSSARSALFLTPLPLCLGQPEAKDFGRTPTQVSLVFPFPLHFTGCFFFPFPNRFPPSLFKLCCSFFFSFVFWKLISDHSLFSYWCLGISFSSLRSPYAIPKVSQTPPVSTARCCSANFLEPSGDAFAAPPSPSFFSHDFLCLLGCFRLFLTGNCFPAKTKKN